MSFRRTVPVGTLLFSTFFAIGVFLGCEGTSPPQGTMEKGMDRKGEDGRLVIVGGALQSDNTAVYQAVLDGLWGDGPLCVVPTASGAPQNTMEGYVAAFDSVGGAGTAEGVFLTVDNRSEADSPEMADRLRACGGFFFTGGSQSRVTAVFRPEGGTTPAYAALWERFKGGAVVSGSSAGAAIMTDPMISGGSSVGALSEGVRGGTGGGDGEGVLLQEGLGFLEDAQVDQHFLARGRWGRLLVAVLADDSTDFGFGIDENTALVVEDGVARVVGESSVVFLDASEASLEEGGTGGYGIRMYLLGRGDEVELESGTVMREPTKLVLHNSGRPFDPTGIDLFSPWALLHLVHEFGLASDPRITLQESGRFFEFRKGPDFQAVGWDDMGFRGTPLGLSMGPFVLSVWQE